MRRMSLMRSCDYLNDLGGAEMSVGHPIPKGHPGREWLAAIAIIYGALLFLLPIALRVNYSSLYFYFSNAPQPLIPLGVIWLASFLRSLLFRSVAGYLLVSLVGLLLIVAALRWSRRSWLSLALLGVTLLSIVIYPFLNQYRPPLGPAPRVEMRAPTQPGPLEGVIKSTQIGVELEPCHYTLLGWDAAHQLFYKEQCYSGDEQVWSYNPVENHVQPVRSAPRDLVINTCPDIVVSDWVRAPGVQPGSAEPEMRRVYLQGNSRPSPDCQWMAATTQYVYGPEDVIVLKQVE
jgi:hypothetical protein